MELTLQADLYAQKPCSLNVFPLTHRKDLVLQAAIALDRLHGPSADHYWISRCRSLASELKALGCPDDRVRVEILAYQQAVLSTLVEMSGDNKSSTVMQA